MVRTVIDMAARKEEWKLFREAQAKRFEKALVVIIDTLFDIAYNQDLTWREWAHKAGIAYGTIERLGYYETKRPHLMTIWKLADALGFRLVFMISPCRGN